MKDTKTIYELVSPTYTYLVGRYIAKYKTAKIDAKLLEAKFRILIHTVIKGQLRNIDEETGEEGSTELNANVLKDTLGRNSKKIIDLLLDEDILRRKPFIVGKRSYRYYLNTNGYSYLSKTMSQSYWEQIYPREIEILTRTHEYFEERQEEMKQYYADRFFKGNTKFIEKYLHDLALVKIKDEQALFSNVNTLDYQSMADTINSQKKKGQRMTTVGFLHRCYDEIAHYMVEQTSRWSYDDRGRIYHRLTRSPRILRHHFNIKFSIDNHNSQPLLFSTLLTRECRITREQLDIFCDMCEHDEKTRKYPLAFVPEDTAKPIHLLPICKEKYSWSKGLISDEIIYAKKLIKQVEKMNKVPADVWNYIYVTMNGTFWNIFQERGYSRDKVKQDLFAQVFYRKKTKRGKVPLIYGESGRAFQDMFPNVAEAITTIIRKHEDSWLPNEMTRVESVLMREILQKVWKHGFTAVNLHDAIEIIKVPKGVTLDEGKQMVKNCFREVFRKREHLLCSPDE